MAKQMTIVDNTSGKTYTLEFTRKSIQKMEESGFTAEGLKDKPMTMIPELFAGAFIAHHPFLKRADIDNIFDHLSNKKEMFPKLVEMLNEPIQALMGEPEESEGNSNWAASW